MNEIINRIEAVMKALSGVSASGVDNWNRLLGSVQTLAEIKHDLMEMKEVDEDG